MATKSKIDVEIEVKSSVEKIWDSITYEFPAVFPKAFPDVYQSVEVLEGDGTSVGSTRLVKYTPGLSKVTCKTDKIEAFDAKNKSYSYSVIDGDLLKVYKNFKATISVTPKGDGVDGSVVKYSAELEKASAEIPERDIYKEFVIKNFIDLDAYLLKA